MNYAAVSEKGKVRNKNEDNYLISNKEEFDILAVADGMGGHEDGDVASSLAIETVREYSFRVDKLHKDIKKVIELANEKIYKKNKESGKKMGTTLTIAAVKKNQIKVAHVGDSRAYLFTNKKLEQVTNDHSYVAELLRQDLITKTEAKDHPKKNMLLNALGTEMIVDIDIIETEFSMNELFILCSDGLSNMLTDEQISNVLSSKEKLEAKIKRLVDIANKNGGYDNITVLIYKNSEKK